MAGGIWSRKFDHKNGETRQCNLCSETFHATKPGYVCRKCINAKQRRIEEVKRGKYARKDVYPFNNKNGEASSRFCSIRTALSNAWKQYNITGDKSIIISHYNKQLKEAEELGILKWIYDRRCIQAQSEKHVKTKGMINKELPDTRGYYEY
jgi:hypothetical protein